MSLDEYERSLSSKDTIRTPHLQGSTCNRSAGISNHSTTLAPGCKAYGCTSGAKADGKLNFPGIEYILENIYHILYHYFTMSTLWIPKSRKASTHKTKRASKD